MGKLISIAREIRTLLGAGRFWLLVMLPSALFAFLAWATPDPVLIIILRVILIALAVNVDIAYGPETYRIIVGRSALDRQGFMIVGVFTSWATYIYMSGLSLIWRYYGQPPWMINSDLASFPIFLGCYAATLHISPNVMHGRVPTRRLLFIGAIAAMITATMLFSIYASDIWTLWQRSQAHQVTQGWMRSIPGNAWATRGSKPEPEDFIAGPQPEDETPRPQSYENDERLLQSIVNSVSSETSADDVPRTERIETTVTPSIKERVEQYRIANGLRSIAEAARRLVRQGLDDDDKSAIQAYRPKR